MPVNGEAEADIASWAHKIVESYEIRCSKNSCVVSSNHWHVSFVAYDISGMKGMTALSFGVQGYLLCVIAFERPPETGTVTSLRCSCIDALLRCFYVVLSTT